MKTEYSSVRRARKSQNGSAVLVVLAVLAILVILLAANTATLNWLRHEVNAVDKSQTQRLASPMTNQLHTARPVGNPAPTK
jgi:hypothetical protein